MVSVICFCLLCCFSYVLEQQKAAIPVSDDVTYKDLYLKWEDESCGLNSLDDCLFTELVT